MIGVSEATNLGIRLGLEPEMIAKVINTSSGRCWSSDTYNPCPGIIEGIPSSNNYQGGFASQLMVKVSWQEVVFLDKKGGVPLCHRLQGLARWQECSPPTTAALSPVV